METTDCVIDGMRSALDELDRCLGWRNAGVAVSGTGTPSFKHILTHEDPARFTIRILVAPMIAKLGYGEVRGPFPDRPLQTAGSLVVAVGMNRALDEDALIDGMRRRGCVKGIATDGFRWTLAVRTGGGIAVTRMDLRPCYVAILESRRFCCSVDIDIGTVEGFVRRFSRRYSHSWFVRVHESAIPIVF